MSNRTTHKLKNINLVLTDIVERQTKKITTLEAVIHQHEAASRILEERLELSSNRANAAETRATESEQKLAQEIADQIKFEVGPVEHRCEGPYIDCGSDAPAEGTPGTAASAEPGTSATFAMLKATGTACGGANDHLTTRSEP